MTKKKKNSKKKTTGPEIHCKYDELIDPKKLKPHPANPNTHPEKQVKLLARIISAPEIGIRWPITVSRQSGFIVAGHCRREAALELKLRTYPVVYQAFKTPEVERLILINDNAIQELAEIKGQIMADNLVALDDANLDLTLTALDPIEIKDYVQGPLGNIDAFFNTPNREANDKLKEHICPHCGKNIYEEPES